MNSRLIKKKKTMSEQLNKFMSLVSDEPSNWLKNAERRMADSESMERLVKKTRSVGISIIDEPVTTIAPPVISRKSTRSIKK